MSNKRAALYVRVSTDAQTVENQLRELRQVAERRGWEVIQVYSDAGISGAKSRNGRPGLDSMLKDASRRKFDIVMAWAIDRLGRSLIDLLHTIQQLEACGVDLYLDQQAIDTTTPMGKLVFQVTGAFAEFERTMIRQRIKAGLKRAVAQGVKLGRPKLDSTTERKVRKQLAKGMGILKVAKSLEACGLTLPPKPKSGRVPVLSQMSQSSRSVDGIHAKPLGVLGPFARQLEKKLTTTWIAHRGSLVKAVPGVFLV
jgi:DNA invertase Pin-like site-specific DNA recombinase